MSTLHSSIALSSIFQVIQQLTSRTVPAVITADRYYGATRLSVATFDCLKPGFDFFDTIVDTLMRIAAKCMEEKFFASVYVVGSNFIEMVMMGLEEGLLSSLIREKGFRNDLWLVPSHVSRSHWILFVVVFRKKLILVLDSSSVQYDVSNHLQVQYLLGMQSHL